MASGGYKQEKEEEEVLVVNRYGIASHFATTVKGIKRTKMLRQQSATTLTTTTTTKMTKMTMTTKATIVVNPLNRRYNGADVIDARLLFYLPLLIKSKCNQTFI